MRRACGGFCGPHRKVTGSPCALRVTILVGSGMTKTLHQLHHAFGAEMQSRQRAAFHVLQNSFDRSRYVQYIAQTLDVGDRRRDFGVGSRFGDVLSGMDDIA